MLLLYVGRTKFPTNRFIGNFCPFFPNRRRSFTPVTPLARFGSSKINIYIYIYIYIYMYVCMYANVSVYLLHHSLLSF
jgi:hypothetical protein